MTKGKVKNKFGIAKWRTMTPVAVPFEADTMNVVACFQNKFVTVFIKEIISPVFKDNNGQPLRLAHLMLQWNPLLRGNDDYFYKLKMMIKDELCGEQSEFVELGVARWREVNFKQTHLWVTPNGTPFPLGIVPTDAEQKLSSLKVDKFDIKDSDLQVCVVTTDNFVEVFVDSDEAEALYAASEHDIKDSKVEVISLSEAPIESGNVAWTDKAKAKLVKILSLADKQEHGIDLSIDDQQSVESSVLIDPNVADDIDSKLRIILSDG